MPVCQRVATLTPPNWCLVGGGLISHWVVGLWILSATASRSHAIVPSKSGERDARAEARRVVVDLGGHLRHRLHRHACLLADEIRLLLAITPVASLKTKKAPGAVPSAPGAFAFGVQLNRSDRGRLSSLRRTRIDEFPQGHDLPAYVTSK